MSEHVDPAAAPSGAAHAHIPGWGADLDPANRPAYPKERTPPRRVEVQLSPIQLA